METAEPFETPEKQGSSHVLTRVGKCVGQAGQQTCRGWVTTYDG